MALAVGLTLVGTSGALPLLLGERVPAVVRACEEVAVDGGTQTSCSFSADGLVGEAEWGAPLPMGDLVAAVRWNGELTSVAHDRTDRWALPPALALAAGTWWAGWPPARPSTGSGHAAPTRHRRVRDDVGWAAMGLAFVAWAALLAGLSSPDDREPLGEFLGLWFAPAAAATALVVGRRGRWYARQLMAGNGWASATGEIAGGVLLALLGLAAVLYLVGL